MAMFNPVPGLSRLLSRRPRQPVVDLSDRDPNAIYECHEAVMRCPDCADTGRCSAWPSQAENRPGAPVFCRNRLMLDEVAEQRRAH